MLSRMILHTILAVLVIGVIAFAYQASSQVDGIAGAASGLAHLMSDDGHARDDD